MLKMIECGTTTSSCAVLSWVMNTELCVQLCDPIDCSHPGSFVHGIFQERILERVAISSSRRSSQPKDWTCLSVSLVSPELAGRFFTHWAIRLCYIFINSFINQVIRVWVQKRFRNSVQGRIRHHRSFWSTALLNSASPSPGRSFTKGQCKKA